MNVFYEEESAFRVGAVLADNVTSLQVEAPHGKRSKIKAASVLLRFDDPPLHDFLGRAQAVADSLDTDFLWECCDGDEFSFDGLARDYFGREPAPQESAGVLLRLHGAPMHFYKRGKGRFRPAPPDALRAALASVEKKRQLAAQQERYVAALRGFRLPDEFVPELSRLLYAPDRASLEWKALEAVCAELKLTPARLLEKCGALPSSRDYHFNRFLFEFFPDGTEFPDAPLPAVGDALPPGEATAFSIDDSTTTEIDDAFSVAPRPDGGWRVGIHIAAPALGLPPGSPWDDAARRRLSTVYMPGDKITMLPETAIRRFTLDEGRECPALSMYLDVAPDFTVRATASRLERVRIAANLRHDELERVFNEETLAAGAVDHPLGTELAALWKLAQMLELVRGKPEANRNDRAEYNFYVADDRIRIVERRRGAPIDRVVSELMIFVNAEWGRQLADAGIVAVYRSQNNGKVKMSTVAAPHQGLGVAQYIWASSPLRRYVDLLNQRQLLAWLKGEPPPYDKRSDDLLTAMRDFEVAYDAYNEFQRVMERYWSLRWLIQEAVERVGATVIKENLVKLDHVPLVARVPSLPESAPGSRVDLEVSNVDLLDLTLHCQFRGRREE